MKMCFILHRMFLLSLFWALQLSKDVPADARIFLAIQLPQDLQQYAILLWPKVVPFAV
jgi:hypothetical protein